MDHHIIKRAEQTIVDLRRQNEVLQAKVDTMDLFRQVLNSSSPVRNQACAIDVAWELHQLHQRIENELTESPVTTSPACEPKQAIKAPVRFS